MLVISLLYLGLYHCSGIKPYKDIDFSWNIKNKNYLKPKEFWISDGQETLRAKLNEQQNKKIARNVVLFLGDGLSVTTASASRIYEGQKRGNIGERNRLYFEKFPYVGLSKTYCADRQVPDSACTATAYLGGVKGNYNTLGVSADVELNDCIAARNPKNQIPSLAAWAQYAGKSTGLVTTTRVTHASPAGVYAHSSNRDFECDGDGNASVRSSASCDDIAKQMIEQTVGRHLNVIMGGGLAKFLPNTTTTMTGIKGERKDGRDLVNEWLTSKYGKAVFVDSKMQLRDLDYSNIDYLMGLFSGSHMSYHLDNTFGKQPSLAEMTRAAIKILSKNPNGFFLFVEGGRIDTAHHETRTVKALAETVEFDKAIRVARELANDYDTLIIVTADHSHTMTFNGYPHLNNPITSITSDDTPLSISSPWYSTLSYANGPSFANYYKVSEDGKTVEYVDVRNMSNFGDKDFQYPAGYPLALETHGGDDVAVYASGPWEHLFSGVMEQSAIPHLINFASCMGAGLKACYSPPPKTY